MDNFSFGIILAGFSLIILIGITAGYQNYKRKKLTRPGPEKPKPKKKKR